MSRGRGVKDNALKEARMGRYNDWGEMSIVKYCIKFSWEQEHSSSLSRSGSHYSECNLSAERLVWREFVN